MQLIDGICTFYRPDSARGSGNFPGKTAKVMFTAWYGERVVGFSRFYAAQRANTQIDMLIRILRTPDSRKLGAGDLCRPADGKLYEIKQVQFVRDEDAGCDCVDVSLERVGEKYELA